MPTTSREHPCETLFDHSELCALVAYGSDSPPSQSGSCRNSISSVSVGAHPAFGIFPLVQVIRSPCGRRVSLIVDRAVSGLQTSAVTGLASTCTKEIDSFRVDSYFAFSKHLFVKRGV